MDGIDAGADAEALGIELVGRADTGRAVVERARLGLRRSDQRPNRVDAARRRDDQRLRQQPERRHARQVALRVVGRVGIGRRRDGVGRRLDQQRVAVGPCAGDGGGADRAARSRLVLDDEGLAELLAELLGDHARHHVGRAAGGQRHDDVHRPVGPALRVGAAGNEAKRQSDTPQDRPFHVRHHRVCARCRPHATPLPTAGRNPRTVGRPR